MKITIQNLVKMKKIKFFTTKKSFEKHFLQYWKYVKDSVDENGWVYSKNVNYLLDACFVANTNKPIEFQKSYEGEWKGYRWRPKSISEELNQ